MKSVIEWLMRANEVVEYGEVVVRLIYHQGQLISSEKQILHKEKYKKEKKPETEEI